MQDRLGCVESAGQAGVRERCCEVNVVGYSPSFPQPPPPRFFLTQSDEL